jgi:hypothetical protein
MKASDACTLLMARPAGRSEKVRALCADDEQDVKPGFGL